MLKVGMFLGERYEILEKIGSGGMSEVYKAKCHKLNRYVAIKVLKDEYSFDRNFVLKFKIEAQSAAGLSHPNIVSIYDVGDDGQIHYIVMELVEGITLKSYIQRKNHLEIRESVGIAIQVAQGIEAAHEQHIVHRDIKPQNIIISKDGKIKVMDFGIARAASTETINSNAIGSVHYISPEQARGVYCDERSDIYSLGITIYEMVTGRLPYEGDSSVAVAVLHLTGEIVPPREYVPDIPFSLEQIIFKCTEKKAERRYSSAMELIADLKRFLITPDDDFVKIIPANDSSPTVMFSRGDVEQIKQISKTSPNGDSSKLPSTRSAMSPSKQTKLKDDEDDEDTNPKIERILNIVGIGVAILIVALVIFLIGNFPIIPPHPSTESGEENASTLASDEVIMPDVVGLIVDAGEKLLADNELGRKITYENSETVAKNYIISQGVPSGDIIKKYTRIEITVSDGPTAIEIASLNITSLSLDQAKAALLAKNLNVNVLTENSDTVEKDKITRYEPLTGLKAGDTVTIYTSLGPAIVLVKIPDLVNLTEQAARDILTQNKLSVGTVTTKNSDSIEKGRIISQGISPNLEVVSGTTVDYVVSDGPVPTKEKAYKYYSTINVVFDCASFFGPGGGGMEVQVVVLLRQTVNGDNVDSILIPTATVSANSKITIDNNKILGADGVTKGEVLVVNAESKEILKTYSLTFTKTEVPQ